MFARQRQVGSVAIFPELTPAVMPGVHTLGTTSEMYNLGNPAQVLSASRVQPSLRKKLPRLAGRHRSLSGHPRRSTRPKRA